MMECPFDVKLWLRPGPKPALLFPREPASRNRILPQRWYRATGRLQVEPTLPLKRLPGTPKLAWVHRLFVQVSLRWRISALGATARIRRPRIPEQRQHLRSVVALAMTK